MRTRPLTGCPIRILFLMGAILLFSCPSYGQSNEATLSLRLQNATLEEFIRRVETATDYSFVYSEEVKLARPISLNTDGQPLRKVLDLAFTNQPVTYQITGKHILLKKKIEKPVSRKFTISGYVTDGTSSETLIGANIFESRQQQGTATNPYGFYSLTLPEGTTSLSVSYLGYTTRNLSFSLKRDTVLNIQLSSNLLLDEIVVVSDKVEAGIKATQMSAVDIPITQIKNTPTVLGEADVLKTLQLLPGVQAGMESSAGLYVRGGGPDQNLILLDGIPVYNIDHLFGFFSVFTPEAIKKVTLFKGSFPARFGGRLSSVVDVRTNDGDMKKYHGTISVGLLTSKLHFEGPIIKDRTSFNISLRRTYFDLLASPFMKSSDKMGYHFYDVNAKLNHKFSDRSRLFLSFYQGKDKYSYTLDDEWGGGSNYTNDYSRTKLDWGNTVVSSRWNYIFNSKLFSNTTLAYNHYKMITTSHEKYTNSSEVGKSETQLDSDFHSGINDWSWQTDFDFTPSPRHHIKFGAGYLYHTFHPEVSTSKVIERQGESSTQEVNANPASDAIKAHEASAYMEDNFELTPQLSLNAGLHFSLFHVQKKTYHAIEPRLSLRYQLSREVALKAAYTQMTQYVQLLTGAPVSLPTDLWVPVTDNIKPMQSHQFSLGGYYTGIAGWEFSAEAYYKNMKNVLEYKDAVSFFGTSSNWVNKVEMGTGRAAGIELMIQKTAGKTTGWVAYTLAKSDRLFENGSINYGRRFPYKFDRRHSISILANHKFSNRIDVGASWTYNSGCMATIPMETTALIRPGGGVSDGNYVESRNNYRLPPSHLLNLGINFNKKTKHGMRTWSISLYNVYNAMNPNMAYYKAGETISYKTFTPEGVEEITVTEEKKPKLTKWTVLTLIPSVTYTYKF